MAKGLKQTSSTLIVSASVTESGANTFTQQEITLALDPLNQEVFVIQSINLDVTAPNAVAGVSTSQIGTVSSTQRTDVGSIANNNVIAQARDQIVMAAGGVDGAAFQRNANETFQAEGLEWIGIVATDNFFLSTIGVGNAAPGSLSVKVYGYRARMDAAGYAAMVQSELLSA